MYKAIIFDLDDTLVKRDTVIPLPGRIDALETISRNKNRIYIATNQSGPAWRRELLEDKKDTYKKYPTWLEMVRKFKHITSMLPIEGIYAAMIPGDSTIAERVRCRLIDPDLITNLYPLKIFTSFRLDWRKPGGGMLEFICGSNEIKKSKCLFVGDLPTDEQAARNAGIAFQYANEFFASSYDERFENMTSGGVSDYNCRKIRRSRLDAVRFATGHVLLTAGRPDRSLPLSIPNPLILFFVSRSLDEIFKFVTSCFASGGTDGSCRPVCKGG